MASFGYTAGIAIDQFDDLFIADRSNNRIRKVNIVTGIITTVAGDGTAGFSGDAGPATAAKLNSPQYVTFDRNGNYYISDVSNRRIRKVSTTGIITTIAGNGTMGTSGDGGPATAAELYTPQGLAFDKIGNLYITDVGAAKIRKIDTFNVITTVAGNGVSGYGGDGGPATIAKLGNPQGVAIDTNGNLFIADYNNNRIRKVDLSTSIISTIAGNGTGEYIGDGMVATSSQLCGPFGVHFDVLNNLYIADYVNNRIRKVDAGSIITTIAGNGTGTFSGDGGAATAASINRPEGVAFDQCSNLFIADKQNQRVRKITYPANLSISIIAPTITTL